MNAEKFSRVVNYCLLMTRLVAPKDTWNLANNGVTLEYVDDRHINVYVNLNIAFYMIYTNEPWLSPKWNGKQNPNEGWWNECGEEIIPNIIEQVFGGVRV